MPHWVDGVRAAGRAARYADAEEAIVDGIVLLK